MPQRVRQYMIIALLVASSTAYAERRAPVQRHFEAVPDEYIVWLHPQRTAKTDVDVIAKAMANMIDGEVLATFTQGVRGFGVRASASAIEHLRDDPRVYRIEENAVIHPSSTCDTFTPDDTTYWHLDRVDQTDSIGGTNAYCWTSDGSGVDVYVVDTGIRADHEQFTYGQVTDGVDRAGADGHDPTEPCGYEDIINGGHGTAVASLIGGQDLGVAKGATLVPVKVFACDDEYEYGIELNMIGAIWSTDWIINQIYLRGNPSVVNFSWFFWSNDVCVVPPPYCDPLEDPYECRYNCASSLEYNIQLLLESYDAVVVASANNQNTNYCTGTPTQSPARMGYGGSFDPNPGSYPNRRLVITVGGTDADDDRWIYNGNLGSNYGSCVDIYAPADHILSAYITDTDAYRNQENVYQSSGTSFSAAIVSGIAARILDAYPSKNPREVWDYIKNSATFLGSNFDGDGVSANDYLVYISQND